MTDPAHGESSVETPSSASSPDISKELEGLSAYIRKVRHDLLSLGPVSMRDTHIKRAATQLDEVIQATEVAANQIMDSCDTLQSVAQEVGGDVGQRIGSAVTTIYEACGFQDLTGQRIVIVNNTLGYIETKLDELVYTFGITGEETVEAASEDAKTADEGLLNGPALQSEANDQSAIDRLLAELG